jgi:hypothetical protein
MTINKHTTQLEVMAMEIARSAKENHKEYFFGGGLAIDFFCGQITRNHHDLDFHPMLEDTDWWVTWFTSKGNKVINRNDIKFPETWWVYDANGKFSVDMWPFRLENGVLFINQNGKYIVTERHWEETKLVEYKRVKIRIENPQRVLEQKKRFVGKNKKYRSVDLHDFKILKKKP